MFKLLKRLRWALRSVPFSTHVAYCEGCKDEREFPLTSLECPHFLHHAKCIDHSDEAFVYYRLMKTKEQGFSGFLRKLLAIGYVSNEPVKTSIA